MNAIAFSSDWRMPASAAVPLGAITFRGDIFAMAKNGFRPVAKIERAMRGPKLGTAIREAIQNLAAYRGLVLP